jgi:hypothetical protein
MIQYMGACDLMTVFFWHDCSCAICTQLATNFYVLLFFCAVELLAGGGASTKPLTDNESLATSLKRLEELLDKVHCYVDDVIVSTCFITSCAYLTTKGKEHCKRLALRDEML